ncbi:uracil phosphoribosyltransferase [Pseudoalteromonas denitrificans]|uniref:Uracil phosphoribosyltransferase n=1 Tax=Pseudoalteromonas denitrificans DSM 6059 TaxID=1123010 RepID=A0A1I1KKU5_9GAMM|nr:uracil phosphoribosyltransferase [Pseudoalteromonas denitrificans]SFC61409.1 uracil phosphoribosyltransferase [Pseudoalteromonas denitrificans DSM 6059]
MVFQDNASQAETDNNFVLPPNVTCFSRGKNAQISERHLYLQRLRNRDLSYQEFRQTANKLFELIADAMIPHLENHEVILTPIFRAGLSLLPVFMNRLENARLCSIGVKRNEETAMPEPYLFKVPPNVAQDAKFVILEPMIATAGTMCYSLGMMKKQGYNLNNIEIISIFCALEAVTKLQKEFPEIHIHTEVVDPILDDHKYIVPGCGDFGDRYFGT